MHSCIFAIIMTQHIKYTTTHTKCAHSENDLLRLAGTREQFPSCTFDVRMLNVLASNPVSRNMLLSKRSFHVKLETSAGPSIRGHGLCSDSPYANCARTNVTIPTPDSTFMHRHIWRQCCAGSGWRAPGAMPRFDATPSGDSCQHERV